MRKNGTTNASKMPRKMMNCDWWSCTIALSSFLLGSVCFAATIERMVGHFETMIAAGIGDPDHKVSELPMLSATETQQLADWNRLCGL